MKYPQLFLLVIIISFLSSKCCLAQNNSLLYVDANIGRNQTDCSRPNLPCDTIPNALLSSSTSFVRIILLSNVISNCIVLNIPTFVKEVEIVGLNETLALSCNFVHSDIKIKVSNLTLVSDFSVDSLQSTIILENIVSNCFIIIIVKSVTLNKFRTSSATFISASNSLEILDSNIRGRFSALNDNLKYSKTFLTNSNFTNCILTIGLESYFEISVNYRQALIKSCSFHNSIMIVKDSSVISISNSIFEGNYDGISNEINSAVLISSYSPSSLTVYDSIFRNNLKHGAVRLIGVGINSFFSNCIFSDNLSHVGGAALYLESVYAAVIENSVFRNNEYQSLNDSSSELGGGAIFQRQSVLITTNCSFINNRADGGMGGAILTTHSTIYNSKADVFYNNTARIGGALATLDTNAFLASTIGLSKFHYNSASILGGAIFVFKCKYIHVEDLTQFVGNSANYGGAIYGVNTKVRIYEHQDILFKDNYEMGPNGEKLVSNLKSFPDAFDMNITDSNNQNTNFNLNFGETVDLMFDLKTTIYSYYINSDSISIDNNLIHVDIQVSGGAVIDFGDSSYKKNKKATFYSYSKERNPFSFTVTLSFTTLKLFSYSTSKSFTIEPTECKPNYWYDLVIQSQNNHQSVYGCGFSWLSVLPFIFLGVIIISIIIIVISIFAFFKIRKMKSKLKILDKKEQAEVELNQRLIELEQLYTSEVQNKYYMKDWMIKIENIKIISKIGEGGMGIVYRGIFSMHEVALKTVKIDSDDLESNEFEREASILSSMRHPNIVGFYGVCVTDTTRFMVTEYMSGGSLDSLIYKCKIKTRHITIPTKISILLGIANGMNYLHTGKSDITIHHRDLKPANILLTNDLIPKVCDFGLSKLSKDSGNSSKTTNIGTLYFIAPEMLLGKDYNHTIDVFSFSIIMWQLIFDETQLYDSSYATNPKFCTFMRSEEIKQFAKLVDSSYILVPKLVTEGLRLPIPKIPIDAIELREWIFEYFINDDAKMEMQLREDSLERYSNGLSALFELMQKCWRESILERPSFHTIAKELESIKNMFK